MNANLPATAEEFEEQYLGTSSATLEEELFDLPAQSIQDIYSLLYDGGIFTADLDRKKFHSRRVALTRCHAQMTAITPDARRIYASWKDGVATFKLIRIPPVTKYRQLPDGTFKAVLVDPVTGAILDEQLAAI